MASRVIIRSLTGDVVVFRHFEDNVRVTREPEVASRFGLKVGEFMIYKESEDGLSTSAESKGFGDERVWYLECGASYILYKKQGQSRGLPGDPVGEVQETTPGIEEPGELWNNTPLSKSSKFWSDIGAAETPPKEKRRSASHLRDGLRDGTPGSNSFQMWEDLGDARTPLKETFNLKGDLQDGEPSRTNTPQSKSPQSPKETPRSKASLIRDGLRDGDVWKDEFLVSVVHAMLHGKGTSRCVQAARKILSTQLPERVARLPEVYDGDHVFELPPFTGPYSKGCFFLGMERKNDCYMWSRLTETGANIGPKLNKNNHSYKIQSVKCLGSMQCLHRDCEYFEEQKEHNSAKWT